MITFALLRTARESDLRAINRLTPQLTPNGGSTSFSEFKKIIADPNNSIVAVKEGSGIIGVGMLVLMRTPLKLRARIECVVIDAEYRGHGLGKKLMLKLMELAKKKKVYALTLGSEPFHEVANKMYRELGFEFYEVNSYRMKF